ncbi:hypothetical protein ABBQ32_004300 [Trebouxia sp. C0010 RCD-2024]
MVEAETDDLPVKHVVVPRNQYGQLCMDSIKEYLAGSGQILERVALREKENLLLRLSKEVGIALYSEGWHQ